MSSSIEDEARETFRRYIETRNAIDRGQLPWTALENFEVRDGRFVAGIERMGMKDGIVRLEINPRLESAIPEQARVSVQIARGKIASGQLRVPTAEF